MTQKYTQNTRDGVEAESKYLQSVCDAVNSYNQMRTGNMAFNKRDAIRSVARKMGYSQKDIKGMLDYANTTGAWDVYSNRKNDFYAKEDDGIAKIENHRTEVADNKPSLLERIGSKVGKYVMPYVAAAGLAFAAISPAYAGAKESKPRNFVERPLREGEWHDYEFGEGAIVKNTKKGGTRVANYQKTPKKTKKTEERQVENTAKPEPKQERQKPVKEKKPAREKKSGYDVTGYAEATAGFGAGKDSRYEGIVSAGIETPDMGVGLKAMNLSRNYDLKTSGDSVTERYSAGELSFASGSIEAKLRGGNAKENIKGKSLSTSDDGAGTVTDVNQDYEEDKTSNLVSFTISGDATDLFKFNAGIAHNSSSVDYDNAINTTVTSPLFPTQRFTSDVETEQDIRSYTGIGSLSFNLLNGIDIGPKIKHTETNVSQTGKIDDVEVINLDDNFHTTAYGAVLNVRLPDLDEIMFSGEALYRTGDLEGLQGRASVTGALSNNVILGGGWHSTESGNHVGSAALSVNTGRSANEQTRNRNMHSLDEVLIAEQDNDLHPEFSTMRQRFWTLSDNMAGFNPDNLVLYLAAGKQNDESVFSAAGSIPFTYLLDGTSLEARVEHMGGDNGNTEFNIGPRFTTRTNSGTTFSASLKYVGTDDEDAGSSNGFLGSVEWKF